MPMRHEDPAKPLVVIPTYNERDNVSSLIPEILQIDPKFHLLVVDDGSPDGTADAVHELKRTLDPERIFLLSRSGKLGLAKAYLDGFAF